MSKWCSRGLFKKEGVCEVYEGKSWEYEVKSWVYEAKNGEDGV